MPTFSDACRCVTLFVIANLIACGAPPADSGRGRDSAVCEVDPMEIGLTSRPVAPVCDPDREPLEPVDPVCAASTGDGECVDHSACVDGVGGRCRPDPSEGDCKCQYDECQTDEDCGERAVCACGEIGSGRDTPINRCVTAECRLDSNCGSGLCLAAVSPESCTPPDAHVAAFRCATDADECRNDDTCEACFEGGSRCLARDGAAFQCEAIGQSSCE